MKPLVILLGISLLCNTAFVFSSWQRNIVVSVPDGDSLQLRDGRRIRLLGVDAPERGRCMADNSREALETIAKNRHVRLKNVVTDDYGRQLAHVIIEDFPTWISYIRYRFFRSNEVTNKRRTFIDPFINRLMIEQGLAKFTGSKNEYYDTLKTAQTNAKEHYLGIWSETCRKTTNPDCSIKGNIRAGKKTYLMETCKNYDQTIIDTSYGDRWFCTEDEAVRAGFFKAAGCPTGS